VGADLNFGQRKTRIFIQSFAPTTYLEPSLEYPLPFSIALSDGRLDLVLLLNFGIFRILSIGPAPILNVRQLPSFACVSSALRLDAFAQSEIRPQCERCLSSKAFSLLKRALDVIFL